MTLVFNHIYYDIIKSLTSEATEQGGIIGEKNGVICYFEKDLHPSFTSQKSYIPNSNYLENIIETWNSDSIVFLGIIHSHRINPNVSLQDVEYARQLLLLNNYNKIYLGIVVKETMSLHMYSITPVEYTEVKINIIDD